MRIGSLLSPSIEEKIAQHPTALLGEHSSADLSAVIELRMIHDLENAAAGSGLGVVGGIHEADDAGVQDSAGAHGAGLEGDVEGAATLGGEKAIVRERLASLAHGDDLGV